MNLLLLLIIPLLKKKLCKEERIVALCVWMMRVHKRVPTFGGYRSTSCTLHPLALYLTYWHRVCHKTWISPIKTDWLASNPQVPPPAPCPICQHWSYRHVLHGWCLAFCGYLLQIQILTLTRQGLSFDRLWHLSSLYQFQN